MAKKIKNYWDIKVTELGRKRILDDPDKMWEKAIEYFEWCVANPLLSEDFKGKDALRVTVKHTRAFTIEGLCFFLGVGKQYFDDYEKKAIANKTDEKSLSFSLVIKRIRETIRNQKFEGASANLLNPMIIARDLGLAEKKQIQTEISMNQKELEEKFKELPDAEQLALLSLAERLGFEDADFEEIDE